MHAAYLALAAAACGGPADGSGGSSGGGGDAPACPPAAPVLSGNYVNAMETGSCTMPDLVCYYEDEFCLLAYRCIGSSGEWAAGDAHCSIAPVPCGSAAEGDPCDFPGSGCMWSSECFYGETICRDDHRWAVYDLGVEATPPCGAE